MQSEAHPTRTKIECSSLLVSTRDRFAKIVPAIPDKFVAPSAAALVVLYGIGFLFYLLPFSLWIPWFWAVVLIGSAIFVRNSLAESQAEKVKSDRARH